MRSLLALLVLASPAYASVDEGPPDPDDPPQPRFAGPFDAVTDYCAAVTSGQCDPVADDPDDGFVFPAPQGPFRGLHVINLTYELHVVMQTSAGWYGVRFEPGGNGELMLTDLRYEDVVRDRGEELFVGANRSHMPCGACDDSPTFDASLRMVCTVDRHGVPSCTEPIEHSRDDFGTHVEQYDAEWSIRRDGTVRPRLRGVVGIARRERRLLARPFKLRFLHD